MAYATTADATGLYGSDYVITSCDRDNNGTLDTSSFETWLDVASDEIDGYLSGRYALPLANVPRIFIKFCVDLAIYHASSEAGPMTTIKQKRYDAALLYLQAVGEGKIKPVRSGEQSVGTNQPNAAILTNQRDQISDLECGSREFTRDKLRGL